MQQTKSYWRVVAALGVVSAFVASACVVTSTSDNGTGGDGGETNTTAGSTSAGGASAGSNSTAGSTSATDYQCDMGDGGAPPGTAADCSPDAAHATDACALCLQAQCCTELGECYATAPGNQCGYGGPNDGGEYTCFQQCVHDGFAANGVDDPDLRTMCSGQCTTSTDHQSSHDCGQNIGTQTNALIACLSDNCVTQCIGG